MGDFNAKHADWLAGQTTSPAGKLAMEFCRNNDLLQVISEATHGLYSSNPSNLDLIFLNKPSLFQSCSVIPPLSDHCPMIADLHLLGHKRQPPISHECWDFEAAADLVGLEAKLAEVDWSPVVSCNDVNTAVELWSTLFLMRFQGLFLRKKLQGERELSLGTAFSFIN